MYLRVLYFVLLSICYLKAEAGPVELRFPKGDTIVLIDKWLYDFEDKEGTFTVDQINKWPPDSFRFRNKELIAFGNSVSVFWAVLHLQEPLQKGLHFYCEQASLEYVDIFFYDQTGKIIEIKNTGSLRPFSSRNFDWYTPNFPIPEGTKKVIFRVRSYSGLNIPFKFGTLNAVVKFQHRYDLFTGLYLGVMLIMLFYNLTIYGFLRDRSYLYYCAYMVFSLLMMVKMRGIGFDLFWRHYPDFNRLHTIIPSMVGIFAAVFAKSFLKPSKYYPAGNYLFNFIIITYAFCLVIEVLYIQPLANNFFQLFTLLQGLINVFVGLMIWRRGNKTARIFLLSWTFLIIGNFLIILTINGFIKQSFVNFNAFQITSALQAVFLSLALADRINSYKRETEIAKDLAYKKVLENEKLVREQNVVLEGKVEERTSELNKTLEVLNSQKMLLEKEKKKSDRLLHNILPEEVANELKEKGFAEAKYYQDVSVLFTDFKDFTKVAEVLSPSELVSVIDYCFRKFDEITTECNLEKIKTIGDAYLAVCGLPNGNPDHALNTVRAAIKIRDFMNDFLASRNSEGKQSFELRIGISSGPVVAGIVGSKKFAYDIWGDTVNTAARMEQNSEVGKINISGTTYELVKDKINCQYRGKLQAKNKGLIDMYFVESQMI